MLHVPERHVESILAKHRSALVWDSLTLSTSIGNLLSTCACVHGPETSGF